MSTPSARTGGSLDAWFVKFRRAAAPCVRRLLQVLLPFWRWCTPSSWCRACSVKRGFPPAAVFVSTCLVAGVGSLAMGLWANLPMAIGCAISLTAFTAFSLVLGQQISIPVALGAVFPDGGPVYGDLGNRHPQLDLA